jgi:DNA gyrase inhibitor GyrI
MKQTAVEWFSNKSWKLKIQLENKEISMGEYAVAYVKLVDEAKEMEKEQIMNAWENGWENDSVRDDEVESAATKYYNETFNLNEK